MLNDKLIAELNVIASDIAQEVMNNFDMPDEDK
jgi:hypothetical protein